MATAAAPGPAIGLSAGSAREQAVRPAPGQLGPLVGLADWACSVPGVSGGHLRRLAVANQSTLLTDEPTGTFESDGGADVMELFRRDGRMAGGSVDLTDAPFPFRTTRAATWPSRGRA